MQKLIALLAAGLVVGCAGQDAPTAVREQPVAPPSFNFMNGPANPGNSGVFRFQGIEFVGTTDPFRDLIAFHFQADDFIGCGGGSFFEFSDVQWINNVDDIVRVMSQLIDAPIFIYVLSDWDAVIPGGLPVICPFLVQEWLYQGTHTLVGTDSDRNNSSPGARMLTWNGRGDVYDPSGAQFRYQEHQNGFVFPDGSFRFLNEDIRVH